MIDRAEIETKATELGVHAANVERDYVNDWLLVGIYSVSDLRDTLILKGGNGFRKAYLPFTRFSADLDFATQSSLSEDVLRTELEKVCRFAQDTAGIQFVLDRNQVGLKRGFDKDKVVYEARLYFHDFYGKPGEVVIKVKMDVTEFDRIFLPVQSRNLIHAYSDAEQCRVTLRCEKLEELVANKLVCLLQRRHVADLFDYVYSMFFSGELALDRGEIVTTFFRKTIFERHPGVAKNLLLGLPLAWFRQAWDQHIVCPVRSLLGFDDAWQRFGQLVEELFGQFQVGYGERLFFSAEARNKIMVAAAGPTLLRVGYDGVERLVEPYSLAFKRPADGPAREYFYCWDRTGGRSGTQGIKSLLSERIESIETTQEGFEPRFAIELSKNVESGRKDYFSRGFSGGRRIQRTPFGPRLAPVRTGLTYVVTCSVCHREFRRSRHDNALRPHRDRYGNACYGRWGSVERRF
jgi:predicted nucleotidyltransferase component of viral defense system